MSAPRLVVAIDAGNSKTAGLLVDTSGRVRARARGGPFHPSLVGVGTAVDVIAEVIAELLTGVDEPVQVVAAYLAGADSPQEEAALLVEIGSRDWARDVQVGNDTMALLRCGAPDGWGVAVVCGAGTNAIAVAPDGRVEGFPALGFLTGDWGGGASLGRETLWLAVRGEDGRGAPTALSRAVADYFGAPSATAVGVAASHDRQAAHRLLELTPVLFGIAADGDAAALGLVERMGVEVATMALALLARIGSSDADVPVVLGGGVLAAGFAPLLDAVTAALAMGAPRARVVVPDVAPVVGAALLAFDRLGVGADVVAGLLAAERRV